MTKSKKTSKTRQKFDFPMKQKITIYFFPNASRSLLCIQYVAVAFPSEEEVLWRREPLEPIFAPPWIHPWADSAQESTQMCGVMSTLSLPSFGKYPSSNSVVKADYVFQYIDMH